MVRFGRRNGCWGRSMMRRSCRFDHMMDNVRFGPMVLRRHISAAVVSTIMVLRLGLLVLDLRPLRLVATLLTSPRRGKCAAANGNPEDSCEDQLLNVLVHCTTCTFLFT